MIVAPEFCLVRCPLFLGEMESTMNVVFSFLRGLIIGTLVMCALVIAVLAIRALTYTPDPNAWHPPTYDLN